MVRGSGWTSSEIRLIKEFYPKYEKEKLLQALPNRTWRAISGKAQKLGIKVNRQAFVGLLPYYGTMSPYILGHIGETIAKKKLVIEGFKISPISLHFCLNGCIAVFGNPKRIKGCPYCHRIKPYSRGCPKGEKWTQLMSYAYKLLKDKSWYPEKKTRAIFFDSLVEKDGTEYLVEIKTNTGRLTPWQEEMMKKARSLGYKTLLVKCFVKLSYDVNVKELI